jgi:hypothetical protein
MALSMVATDPSPWEFGWEALVAIGTILLSVATGALALSTRNLAAKTAEEVEHSGRLVKESQRQVAATQDQARAAQEALAAAHEQTRLAQLTLNAQSRPVLVDVPLDLSHKEPIFYSGRDAPVEAHRGGVHVHVGDEGAMISVPMRNAGVGLAMIRGISLEVGEATPPAPVTIQPANVPAGEYARLSFLAAPEHPAFAAIQRAIAAQNFSVVVSYSDLAGQQMTLSRFDVYFRSRAHYNWEVRQVHLQEPGADHPFAGSAPTA